MKLFFIFTSLICLTGQLATSETLSIGVILDPSSRSGREVGIAVELAAQRYKDFELSVHFHNLSADDPLQAARAAENLIEDVKVEVVIFATEAWQKSALVAAVGAEFQVPNISVSESAITPPLASVRWPFLVQMSTNGTEQAQCIAAIVGSYQWRRVIVIYEDDIYSGDSGMLDSLAEALQGVGSEIERRLVLPPYSSLTSPEDYVQQEMVKLQETQSRAFIVLRASAPMAAHLFKQAKELGLMWRDSAWVMSSDLSNSLDSYSSNVIASMEGALGIKSFYSETATPFVEFVNKFKRSYRMKYPEEDKAEPGMYALRAYDAVSLIVNSVSQRNSTESTDQTSSRGILEGVLSSNFTGLTGDIRFADGGLSNPSVFRIVNVIGKSYKELDFWKPGGGFSEGLGGEETGASGKVNWPGGLVGRTPKGWSMPTKQKPLRIGVPGRTSFEKFVKVTPQGYDGFCIALFEEVVKILEQNYSVYYNFTAYNGTYDDLVDHVTNRSFDAIVGDVTILANRSKYVAFTQPYAESGLTMIVPVRTESQAWMFTKPFTASMWLVTCAILIYTMFIVWFLEHHSNPEFRGPWKSQIGTTTWFTFSTLFFAHREKIHSNFTRVVVVIWLFVVLVLTSSYTANLSSMLTVPRLQPNWSSIESLKTANLKVGCDGDSFVRKYLVNVLDFKPGNIVNIDSQYEYPAAFQNGKISAAFLELPYEKVFIGKYCKGYTVTTPTYRFGGLGFVFQLGSPITRDVSRAILILSENGKLKQLEDDWFAPSKECSSDSKAQADSLSLRSFWGLYVISCATSTLCFLLFLARLVRAYGRQDRREQQGNSTPANDSVWDKTLKVARYFHNGEIRMATPARPPTVRDADEDDAWSSSSWVPVVTPDETPQHDETPPQADEETPQRRSSPPPAVREIRDV
uniref:Glutamate receptor n=1 Tax=Kalanchoe fedtschenkoi TaxID=63787 RepID=A0A7N1A7I1_KALFE